MSTTIPSTPITLEQWRAAKPGSHAIRDAHGRQWEILSNIGEGAAGPEILARCPGHREDVLKMTNVFDGRHIVDEEWGILMELHSESVAIIEI